MKKTLFVFLLLCFQQSFADECQELYQEAVRVEKECMQYVKYINAEIDYGNKLIQALSSIPYPTAREREALAGVKKKVKRLSSTSQQEVNKRCDKRWDVASIYLEMCSPQGYLECNEKGYSQYDLNIYSPSGQKHSLHTYDKKYECLVRKRKIKDTLR